MDLISLYPQLMKPGMNCHRLLVRRVEYKSGWVEKLYNAHVRFDAHVLVLPLKHSPGLITPTFQTGLFAPTDEIVASPPGFVKQSLMTILFCR